MNLINTLRMYAEDMHSATGYNERSSAMSKAADMIEKFENMSACEACATIPSVMEYVQQLEQERDAALQACDDLANEMIYRGNSVAWWHSKATAYREAVDECWKALGEAGIKTDGNTHVADAIRQLAARSNAALTGAEKAA